MTITDRDRRKLFDKLAESIGEAQADNLMQLLPPQPYSELATRDDVLSMAATLRGEMAELRGEMAELRGDVAKQIAGLQRWAAGILAANAIAVVTALLT